MQNLDDRACWNYLYAWVWNLHTSCRNFGNPQILVCVWMQYIPWYRFLVWLQKWWFQFWSASFDRRWWTRRNYWGQSKSLCQWVWAWWLKKSNTWNSNIETKWPAYRNDTGALNRGTRNDWHWVSIWLRGTHIISQDRANYKLNPSLGIFESYFWTKYQRLIVWLIDYNSIHFTDNCIDNFRKSKLQSVLIWCSE